MKKKALISSILTIAVCVSLIAGATFALFTSESQVNVAVTAGKVDVQAMILNDTMQLFSALADPTADPNAEGTLIDENGATYIYKDRTKEATFTNGGTATIVGNTLNLDKVTPGDKVTFNIKITNRSNIAVQYRVRVACTYGADLFYGLNFKVNDTDFSKVLSHTSAWKPLEAVESGEKEIDNVTVSVDLPIDAGNRYQDKTCKIVYVVEAVQGNAATSPAPDDEVMSVQWQDLAYGVSVPAAVNGVITIYDEVELAAFAASVNAGNTYKGITVALADDMDLGGAYWTPIGLNGDTAATLFQGTFDGQGHTISNMVVDTLNQNAAVFATRAVVGSYTAAGFFGSLNGTAKNIIFEDASVNHISTGDQTVNGIAVVAGSIYTRGAIDNVHVNNATVAGNRYVGGIAGYVYGAITNCSVTNATLTATPNAVAADKYDNGDKVGGIAGYFQSASVYVISENAVRNVDIFAYRDAGSIVGAGDAGTAVVANEAKNVNIKIDQETYHYGNKDVNAGEIIGRVMSGTVDPTNKAVSVEIVGCATVNGKVYGSLSQVLEEETVGDVTINVPESTTISWKTGAEHGSTPWGAETVGNITVIGAEDGTSKFVATGSGVGPIANNNKNCSITFKNITIVDESVSYAEGSWEFGYLEFAGKVVFENCVFVNAVMVSGDTTFKNCEFNSNNSNEYDVWVEGGKASFTDCLFEGYRGLKMHEAYGGEINSVTVDNCTFNELSKKPGVAIGTLNAKTTVVIKNSSFINCMPGDQQLFIYETDTDVTTFNFTNENNKVQLIVENDEELQTLLDKIKTDKSFWNIDLTVTLKAGTYSNDYVINQYPEWNGTVAHDKSNNYAGGVTAGAPIANVTFVGETVSSYSLRGAQSVPAVIFTGKVTVNGFGDAQAGFSSATAVTAFENIAFTNDYKTVELTAAASNISFNNCVFEGEYVTVGASGCNRIGNVAFDGCTFNGTCISGYVDSLLSVKNSVVNDAPDGFINNQNNGDVTVDNCTVNTGRYFVRTNGSNIDITVTDSDITVYESEGTKYLVYFRGSNESAAFIDCTLPDDYTTEGVDANSSLTIKNYNTFEHNIPGVQIYEDGVTGEVVLDKVSAEAPAKLVIPEGVTTLGSKILEGNTTVKEVVIPLSVTDFGGTPNAAGTGASGGMFYKSAVEKVVLPEGWTEIPVAAFNQASQLKEVNIPASVTTIGINAFAGTGLETLIVPETVKEIGYGAFRDMKSLTSVTIEGDVDIPNYAFRACAVLKNVVLNGKNVTFAGGVITDKSGMIFTNLENGDGHEITIQVENEVIKDRLIAADGAATNYGGYTIKCRMTSDIEEGGSAVEGLFKDEATGALYAYNQNAYEAALSSKATEINVMPGTYTFKTTGLDSTKTVICAEGTVFEGSSSLDMKGATVIGATFSNENGNAVGGTINGTLKDCTFTGSNGLRWCYAGDTVVFENCVFDGDVYGAHFDGGANKAIFRNCTFSGFNAFGEALEMLTLENCTFKANGRSSYNGINLHGNTELTGCTFVFDGSASTEWVDLCKNNKTVTFTNCVVTDGKTEKDIKTVVGNYGVGNTIIVDGAYVVKHDDSTDGVEETAMIKAAVAKGAINIWLADGNYTMPQDYVFQGKTLTISGTKDAVIDISAIPTNGSQAFTGATLVFDGVTLNCATKNYQGFTHAASLTYKNCQINGLQFLFAENVTFENCDLNSNGAEHCVWTYGAKNVTFIGCDFTYGDRGVNCYSDNDVDGGKQIVTFTDCTFNTKNTASDGAVEINSVKFSVGIEVVLNGCTAPTYGEMAYISKWDSGNGAKTIVKVDGVYMVSNDAQLENVLKRNEEVIKVKLLNDVSLNASDAYLKLGGEATTSIEIDGNGKKLTLSTTYWSRLNLVNPNGVLKINNATVTSSQTSGTWNSYDLTFMCNVELNKVVFEKAVALDGCGYAKLTNVTITETHDYYALWISANVGEVTINGCTINSDGRGIKIDDQYVDADDIVCTKLSISNATFTTKSKAAIVVKSALGAEITVGENVDISNVAKDTTNAVWVDEDAANTKELVTVNGATVIVEP